MYDFGHKGFGFTFGMQGYGLGLGEGPNYAQDCEKQNRNADGFMSGIQGLKEPRGLCVAFSRIPDQPQPNVGED